MAFCTRCGKRIEEGQICSCSMNQDSNSSTQDLLGAVKNRMDASVTEFIGSAKSRLHTAFPELKAGGEIGGYQSINAGVSDPNRTGEAVDIPEQSKIGDLKLSDGEFVIRKYICSQLKIPKCFGSLSVTNHRLIFHGFSGNSRLINEVPLDSVSAISSFYGSKLRLVRLILGILLILSSLFLMNMGGNGAAFFALAALSGGIFLLMKIFRKEFVLKVFSSKANNSPIDIGSGYGGLGGNSALFAVVAHPTDQTDAMMLELGAMISDLQRTGNLGAQKWMR